MMPTADQSGAWWVMVERDGGDKGKKFYSSHSKKNDAQRMADEAQTTEDSRFGGLGNTGPHFTYTVQRKP